MSNQTITVKLPDDLYRSADQLARTTKRPIADILQDSLAHTLPPLDDIPSEEAESLAQLSLMSDAELWRTAETNLSLNKQTRLDEYLLDQNAGELDEDGLRELQELQEEYGRLLVQQSHAWLLLARRGYKVPIQNN